MVLSFDDLKTETRRAKAVSPLAPYDGKRIAIITAKLDKDADQFTATCKNLDSKGEPTGDSFELPLPKRNNSTIAKVLDAAKGQPVAVTIVSTDHGYTLR